MKRHVAVAAGLLLGVVLGASTAVADDAKSSAAPAAAADAKAVEATAPAAEHRMTKAGDLKWTDAPAALPKGAKVAILHGDMAAPGLFSIRVTLPAGYKVPPHTHPADEFVTVISGELHLGLGETFDESKGHGLSAGGFTNMPVGVKHFAWAKKETVIQIHAMGPWGITYVNPSDDPRNAKEAAK